MGDSRRDRAAAQVKCPNCRSINRAGQALCSRCNTPLPKVRFQEASNPAPPKSDQQVTFRPGQIVANRYTVLELIGRGGMGSIYKVHDNTLNETVALKTLLPQFVRDKVVIERFYNEARIARQLSHANIIRVHDMGFAGNLLYISMEYIGGKSFREVLAELPPGERLPIETTLRIMDELCAALQYAHQYTIHRDIKPENVMITEDGSIKLMDFGISKLMASTGLTATSMVMGTPNYMSPEQLKDSSSVDRRADIYSLGVLLYECLTGNLPTGIPKPASQLIREVPPALDPIMAKCLEPEPRDRFETITELRNALRPIRELVESGVKSKLLVAPRDRAGRSRTIRRAIGVALILLVAALTGVGIWKLEQWRRELISDGGEDLSPFEKQFNAIKNLMEKARAQLEVKAEGNDALEERLSAADKAWESALQVASSEDPQALTLARHALERFMAPLVQPENMVFVEPGKVVIGAGPLAKTIMLDGFFIDATEVTSEQYYQFCEEKTWRQPPLYFQPHHPVTMVTFYDAQAYGVWAGKDLWARKKLPTEAQWARAAYGPKGTPSWYPWGNEWKDGASNSAGDQDGFAGSAPVSQFEEDRSPFGCWDMAGNVMEWTRTASRGLPHKAGDSRDDEADLYFGTPIVVRGGYYDDSQRTALATRYEELYETKRPDLGFRCVLELPTCMEDLEQFYRKSQN